MKGKGAQKSSPLAGEKVASTNLFITERTKRLVKGWKVAWIRPHKQGNSSPETSVGGSPFHKWSEILPVLHRKVNPRTLENKTKLRHAHAHNASILVWYLQHDLAVSTVQGVAKTPILVAYYEKTARVCVWSTTHTPSTFCDAKNNLKPTAPYTSGISLLLL